jgi:hypothetical protein
VRLSSGATGFEPADEREREVLEMISAGPDQRLGCQLVTTRDHRESEVILRVVQVSWIRVGKTPG